MRYAWLSFVLAAAAASIMVCQPAAAGPTEPVVEEQAETQTAQTEPSETAQGFRVLWRLDSRYMGANEPPDGFMVMAAEADVTASPADNLDIAVQLPFRTAMEGRGQEMHFGNAYLILRRRLGEPTLRLGQFVVPFGNLVYYETHTRIIQTLYRWSLGIRIDAGAELEGFIGRETEFQAAVTNGNGPYRMDNNRNKVLWGRVNRTFEIGDNELRLGLSGLTGVLPVFSVMGDPVMNPDDTQVLEFSRKWRAALDGEIYLGPYLIRAEVIGGEDRGRGAYGHWLQFNYPLSYRAGLEAGLERWSQFSGDINTYWVGGEYKLTDRQIFRFALQHMRMDEMGERHSMTMGTAQVLVEF